MRAGSGSLPLSFVSGCAMVAKLQHKKKAVKQSFTKLFLMFLLSS
jgi:hypothetical protein